MAIFGQPDYMGKNSLTTSQKAGSVALQALGGLRNSKMLEMMLM